jgi:thiosulfate dehydrogenase [quinone] large subunit
MSAVTLVKVREYLINEVQRDNAYLFPLRLFIGIGWVRASLEKLIEAGWNDGSSLVAFFNQQVSGNHVYFPFYQALIRDIFAPHALSLSWVIMIGQVLVGVSVLAGFFTNFALICGLFMNFNFIFAGEVTPSAFYIVIQMALFIGNAGAIFGVDQFLSRRIPVCFLVARPEGARKLLGLERATFLMIATLSLGGALFSVPYIRDYSPHSVDDPAMILLVLSIIIGLSALITWMRLQKMTGLRDLPPQASIPDPAFRRGQD